MLQAQYPELLKPYPVRPSWKVAGVDFHVGCDPTVKLQIPSESNLPPNAQWYNGQVNFIYGDAVVEGWDFTGVTVTINITASGQPFTVKFKNCKFNLNPNNLSIPLTIFTSSDVEIAYCDFDGLKVNTSVLSWTMARAQPTNPLSQVNTINLNVHHCYFLNLPDHGIDFSANGQFNFENNLAYGIGYAPNNHADIIQFSNGKSNNSKVCYNTVVTTLDQASNGCEGIQIASQLAIGNNPGEVTNFVCSNNVVILQGTYGLQSYAIAFLKATGQPLTGVCENNYIDATGGYGPFYPPPPDITYSGNIDLTTGEIITP